METIWEVFQIFLAFLLNWDRVPECLCLFQRVVLVISHFIVRDKFQVGKINLTDFKDFTFVWQVLLHEVKFCCCLFINWLNWFNHYKRAFYDLYNMLCLHHNLINLISESWNLMQSSYQPSPGSTQCYILASIIEYVLKCLKEMNETHKLLK